MMKIRSNQHPFHHVLIDGMYSDEELCWVWKDLDILSKPNIMGSPEETYSAVKDGELLKSNLGIFLDDCYSGNRNLSSLLTFNRKIFQPSILNQPDLWFFRNLKIHQDYTLISYYEDHNYYKAHCDNSTATALTWFYREPKSFNGGQLNFDEFDYSVECKSNRTIIFPSQIKHSVTPVEMLTKNTEVKMGRYCMSQFLMATFV